VAHLLALLLLVPIGSLRFAWLSDTHVGSTTGEEDLRASVREINEMRGIQFVIVSGDVTEFGSDAQLATAKRLLDSLRVPTHVIPGNHDTRWSESGCTWFPRLWGSDHFVFDAGGLRFIGMHEGPRMRMEDGHFAPEDLRWLDSVLSALPRPRQPLVFVTHYPVDSSISNWYEVTDRLRRRNIKIVLVGHGHANRQESFEGIPGLMGRSNLRAGHPAAGFTVVTVDGDSLTAAEHSDGNPVDRVWYSARIRDDYAFVTPCAYPRPDFSVNTSFHAVRRIWEWTGSSTIAMPAEAGGDVVVVGDASGTVTALQQCDGVVVWSFKAGGPVYGRPTIAGDHVVFGSTDGSVYSLSIHDGSLQWKTPTDGPVLGVPAIAGDTIFIGGSDRRFRALRLGDGTVLWTSDSLGGFVETRPLVAGGSVIFGAWDQRLYALDETTGKTRWVWEGGHPGVFFSPAACWPVAAHGRVFIVAPDREMTAIDGTTGRTVWRSARYEVRESIGVSADRSRIYVRTMQDSILAIEPSADSCRAIWAVNGGFGYDINSAMLVEQSGRVLYGTMKGLVLALDARRGTCLWRYRASRVAVNTLCPLDADRIVVTDVDGKVQCLLEGAVHDCPVREQGSRAAKEGRNVR
jgi:outer membrane protein assembly factor BamB/predicted phosphodiesterase